MKILKLRIKTADDWQAVVGRPDATADGAATIFVPTTDPLAAGDDVMVEVTSPSLPNKVLIRGLVSAWRPALPRLRVRAGATVQLPAAEAHKRSFVDDALSGRRTDVPRRRHDRFPVTVGVRYRIGQNPEQHTSELSEVSAGGAMLATPSPLALGTEVILEVTPPGSAAPMTIAARVSYHTPAGNSGLKFVYRDGDGSRRLRELVRRLIAT
ncbi:MAG TPA: PilZ domain-containing protein [Kofleriaceae bacterium]|nr:PilZ domain-containing protein [Kofleriaceae bacterium]